MATGIADFGAVGRAFGNRNYAIYTAGSTVAMVGLWVQRLGVGWLAWELTYSGFWLGAIAFADLFPAVVIGPFAGVLADRMDRLRLARACQWLSLAQTGLLFVLMVWSHIDIVSLMLLTLFLGCVRAVYMPVRLSLVPALVRPDDVPAAIAISSMIFNLARFVGPAAAGLIIARWGVAPTFAFYGVTVVVLLIAFSRLRIDRVPPGAGRGGGMLAQIAEGLRYTASHGAIAPLFLLMLGLSVLARPVGELFPGFADLVFQRGAVGLAWLSSAIGLGAVAGGLWLARRGSAVGLLPIALAGAGVSGGSLILFTGTDIFPIAIPAIGLFGAAVVSCAIATQTLLLSAVEDHMRGRVLSLYGVIFRGGPAVGSLLMGGLSDLFGLRWPMAVGGVLCLVAAIWAWRGRRRMEVVLEVRTGRRSGLD
ncbi:MAG: MFS transporter [Alphaproteobacteria bacterium]|nr:MFS transporter [Alphaproteobacteria bacterium]